MKEKHFPGINQVVINEPKKYDLAKAFKKPITNDISVTEKVNATIDADKIKSSSSSDESRLDEAAIQKVVSQYDLNGKKGVGLVFIMEGLNKPGAKGSMYVTFIDMATRKVIFTERMTGKAGGFGCLPLRGRLGRRLRRLRLCVCLCGRGCHKHKSKGCRFK